MTSLHEKFGYLKGLKVAIIGDISHSRVALSNIYGLKTMGAEIALCGPATLIPPFVEDLGVNVNYNVDEVIDWADALNVLRIQRERMGGGLLPSIREYRNLFGITTERLSKALRFKVLTINDKEYSKISIVIITIKYIFI